MSSSISPRDRLKALRARGVLSLNEYLAELESLGDEEASNVPLGQRGAAAHAADEACDDADDDEDDEEALVDEDGMPWQPRKRQRGNGDEDNGLQWLSCDVGWRGCLVGVPMCDGYGYRRCVCARNFPEISRK